MKIRGNYLLMFVLQSISGLLTYFMCMKFGLIGVGIGFIPFLIALVFVQGKYQPDERELGIMHKSNSYNGIVIAVILAIVYMFFPNLNWFYVYVASISLVRGLIGTILVLTT